MVESNMALAITLPTLVLRMMYSLFIYAFPLFHVPLFPSSPVPLSLERLGKPEMNLAAV